MKIYKNTEELPLVNKSNNYNYDYDSEFTCKKCCFILFQIICICYIFFFAVFIVFLLLLPFYKSN